MGLEQQQGEKRGNWPLSQPEAFNRQTYGVNVGGWLLTEPFIVPNLYLPYQNSNPRAVDEYTLSQAMGNQLATLMTQHYETFITEQDFANIAAAGMNWVRVPVPYWAIDTDGGEPYLEGVAWNYMLQAFGEQFILHEMSSSDPVVCRLG